MRKTGYKIEDITTIMGVHAFLVQVLIGGKTVTFKTDPVKKSTMKANELLDLWKDGKRRIVLQELNLIMRRHYFK